MVDRSKLSCGSGTTLKVANSIEVVDVREETGTFFALGCFLCLFKEIARALLSHDNSYTFKSAIWSNVHPDVGNTARKRETSPSTCLSKLINSEVAIVSRQCFYPRGVVMERIHSIKVATLALFIALLHHSIDQVSYQHQYIRSRQIAANNLEMCLIVHKLAFGFLPRHRLKLATAHRISCRNNETLHEFETTAPNNIHSRLHHDVIQQARVPIQLKRPILSHRRES